MPRSKPIGKTVQNSQQGIDFAKRFGFPVVIKSESVIGFRDTRVDDPKELAAILENVLPRAIRKDVRVEKATSAA